MNLVSVIIVNWNSKKFLAECLDGLKRQTHKNYSIIYNIAAFFFFMAKGRGKGGKEISQVQPHSRGSRAYQEQMIYIASQYILYNNEIE